MIRINLLPVREAEIKKSGRQLVLLFLVFLILEALVLFLFQGEKQADVEAIQKRNQTIERKIRKLKSKTASVESLKEQRAELEKQKAVLGSLIEGQTGPVKMLDELSRMLSVIDDPQMKLDVQTRGWNPDWDPKRLWVDVFVENERMVQISGHARNNEDLAEFLHRLGSARHFVNVELKISQSTEISKLNDARLVRFDLTAMVIYGPADVRRLAAGEFTKQTKRKKRKR